MKIIQQGAEATITLEAGKIVKDRLPKSYRLPELDKKIRIRRTKSEAKLLDKASKIINAPRPLEFPKGRILHMEYINGRKLSDHLNDFELKKQLEVCQKIGQSISKLHKEKIIHGDLTTSNMILKEPTDEEKIMGEEEALYIIDFGLGYHNGKYEDKAVDLHVLKQALEAKHFQNWQKLWKEIESAYQKLESAEAKKVLERLVAVEKRGRYKH